MLELKPWTVVDNNSQGPIVLAGETVGDELRLRFAIDWNISDSEKAIVTDVSHVQCLDGAGGFDPYAVIDELSVRHDQRRVTWEASVHSYRREIRFRVGVLTGFESGIPHRAYTCQDLVLDIQPGPEPVNEPWSKTEGVPWSIPWANTTGKLDVETSDPKFTLQHEKWIYSEPFSGEASVTIQRMRKFHSHATDDLKPRVSHHVLSDGTGIVVTPENLRAGERYAVTVNTGTNHIIYLRTL